MTKRILRAFCVAVAVSTLSVGCEMMEGCRDGSCAASKPTATKYESQAAVPIPPPPAEPVLR